MFDVRCGFRRGIEHRTSNIEHGLTVVELMLVVVLLGLFFGAVYEVVIIGLRTANAADEREAVRQQLANALDRITREAALASNVDVAADQQFQFDADLDGDGSTENNISYEVSSGDLQRVQSSVTVILARDLASLDFDYTDSGGSTLSTPVGSQPTRDTIRLVQIAASATVDNETINVAGAVYLRNNN
ncbi:MAG: hypothetical protein HY599_07330 [Candidatus Omnitrophica bacterium]|nr:hypothetical protein [Candidatus Omnitrophota bacterium]